MLRVGSDDNLVSAFFQIIEYFVKAAVHDIVLLPWGGDKDCFNVISGMITALVWGYHVIQQGIAALNKLFLRKIIHSFGFSDFINHVLAYTENHIIVIHAACPHSEVQAIQSVRNIHILHIVAYKRTLYLVILEIGHCHHHNISSNLHHQRN